MISGSLPRRRLAPPRRTTGLERRWLDPRSGLFKVAERAVNQFFARRVYPRLFVSWHPYNWLLARRFAVAEAAISPPLWPSEIDELVVLVVSDIHCGPFLGPEALAPIFASLMRLAPDLVVVAGDVVDGSVEDLDGFLPALGGLARAPLGAWYARGNHDHYTGDPDRVGELLASVGIRTLRNESVTLAHRGGSFRIGGIDDRIMGSPDWDALVVGGPPHLLVAHNPDDFYDAVRRGVALVVSGHTHGGQIRFPKGPPIVRQSEFCLDEGLYAHERSLLAITRGVGTSGLPWRAGAHPEALWLRVSAPRS
ncbi:MAG: metallophosphoesterase [Candidatus Binatia bacterium]